LDRLRTGWLNPPEWTREEVLEFFTPDGSVDGPWARYIDQTTLCDNPRNLRFNSGQKNKTQITQMNADKKMGTVRYPRLVPNSEEAARELAKRTLTNLYNQRPTWLALAHQKLDSAVFATYGWPDSLTDDEILERLRTLNLRRDHAK